MNKVAVIYWSGTGNTEAMANAAAEGAKAAGAEASLLTCAEVSDISAHTDAALSQLADLGFVGSWKADLSAYGQDYASVDLRMAIDEAGHGVTTMNGEQTAGFEAYAADNGEKGDGIGLYVAYSNLEYEAEAAPYTMTVNDAGQSTLTLTADDGTISWIKQAE